MENEKIIKIQTKIGLLKHKLNITDYQAIKYAEGELTEEEFAETKQKRKEWRAEINLLEQELKLLKEEQK